MLNTIRPSIPQTPFRVFRGSHIEMFGEAVKQLDRLGIHFVHIMQVNLGMDTG